MSKIAGKKLWSLECKQMDGKTLDDPGRKTSSLLGKPLERLPVIYVKDCGYVPIVLTNAANIIEKHIKTKDIFQTQGITSRINAVLNFLNGGRASKLKCPNVHDIIEAVKQFLIRLPTPLLPESVCDNLIASAMEDASYTAYGKTLMKYKQTCPQNVAILNFMLRLLKKVAAHSSYNMVDKRKLATIFVLDIVKPLKLGDPDGADFLAERMKRLPYLIIVIEKLISHLDQLSLSESTRCHQKNVHGSSSAKSIRHQSPHKPPVASTSCVGSETRTDDHQPKECDVARSVSPVAVEKNHGDTENVRKNFTVHEADTNLKMTAREETRKESEGRGQALKEKLCEIAHTKDTKNRKAGRESPALMISSKKLSKTRKASHTSPARRLPSVSPEKRIKHKVDSGIKKRACSRERRDSVGHRANPGAKRRARPSSSCKRPPETDRKRVRRSSSFASVFSTFLPDEEITPWNDAAVNSDDQSLMTNTIRHPRVLSIYPSREMKLPIAKLPAKSANSVQPYEEVNFGFTISGSMKESEVSNLIQAARKQTSQAFMRACPTKTTTVNLSGMSSESTLSSASPVHIHRNTLPCWDMFEPPHLPAYNKPIRKIIPQTGMTTTTAIASEKQHDKVEKHKAGVSTKLNKNNCIGPETMALKRGVSPLQCLNRPIGVRLSPVQQDHLTQRKQIPHPLPHMERKQESCARVSESPWFKKEQTPASILSQDYGSVCSGYRNDEVFKCLQRRYKQLQRKAHQCKGLRSNRKQNLRGLLSDVFLLILMLCCFMTFIYICVLKNTVFT